MGLFSSEIKTYVGTSVSRVIQDSLLPDSIQSAVLDSIFQNGDTVEYIRDRLFNSIGVKAERYYEYGKDHYVHGLPSGEMKEANLGREEATALLASIEGAPVIVEYCSIGNVVNLCFTFHILIG